MTDANSYTVDLLNDLAEYLQDRADADGNPDGYRPNRAMQLLTRVELEIEILKRSVTGTGEESGDVRKSETPQGGVGTQMPREGSIPSAGHSTATSQLSAEGQ